MFTEIPGIKKAVNSFWEHTTQKELRTRWNTDFNLHRLKAYDAGKGYYSYTTNAPRVFTNMLIGMLCQAKPLVKYDAETLDEEERRVAANCERFVYGSFGLNDADLKKIGQPLLQEAMAWLSALRGGFAERVYVYKDKETKETIPEVRIWDMYSLAYQLGADGLAWAAYTRKAKRETIEAEYDIDLAGSKKEATVIDYWDKENNGVIVNNIWAKEPEPHGLDYTPVFICPVGAMPSILSNEYEDIEAHRFQSAFSATRELYPLLNKTLSDLLSTVRRGVKRPTVSYTKDGRQPITEDIWQVEKASNIPLEVGEKIEPIAEETMPKDAAALMQILSGEAQRGSFSHTTYGELGFRLSGFAITQLQGAIAIVLSPFLQAMERGYEIAASELSKQYTAGGFTKINIRGRTSRNEPFGYPKAYTIRPSDIKGDWLPEVRLEPTLPKDDAQRYQLANLARMGDTPLLSDRTIRDELLHIDDPDLENEKVFYEFADNLTLNRLRRTFEAQMAQRDMAGAQLTLMMMQQELSQLMPQRGATPARTQTQPEVASMETPGAGVPPTQMPLFPTSVMPPEAMGGFPPGALGAGAPPGGGF